jgi:Peptidase family M20/M25/M40/IS1 transposase
MGHQEAILDGFKSLLEIPNVASDPAGLDRNAKTLVSLLQQRHCAARLLSLSGVSPVVFGERRTAGATHTVVFYAHYDGQPITLSEWQTPPFRPTLQEVKGGHRIYARSASDDKAAIYAQLVALDAVVAQAPVPAPWRTATCYTDFWKAYQAVVPDAQHAAGKGAGETAPIEQFNDTLRQRPGEFVRKTLSFLKCDRMHDARLPLFLHRYHLSRA